MSYRCYTKKTSGKGFQFPSLQRWRESNTIKKTLVRYLKNKLKRLSEDQDDPAIGDLGSSPDTEELFDIAKSKHVS